METEIIFCNLLQIKKMEFMPEGCTPIEYDESPELIITWATQIAYVNVTRASQLMENDSYDEYDYRRYLQAFEKDLRQYKKEYFQVLKK
jgi:hypothetical protein